MQSAKPPVTVPASPVDVQAVRTPPRLMDVQTVADELGVSVRHVYRMADAGKMPAPVKLGGANRWDRKIITPWIDGGCMPVTTARRARL